MELKDSLIRITSWNVAGKDPTTVSSLDYLFDDTKRMQQSIRPDIQIVGLQEAPQYLFTDPWTSNLSSTLKRRGYILFKRHKLSGILLYIFVLREIILRCRDMETESVKTGFGGLLGNKGGVSLRFTYNGNSFCATTAHLAAHQENLQQRIQDYNSILDGTKFLIDTNTSSILMHDYSFWFGDLNFRLDDIEKHNVLTAITKAKTSPKEESYKILSELLKHDQLSSVKNKGLAFEPFNESLPSFLPTYKFQIGEKESYDSDQRIPAWTDRILYRVNNQRKSHRDANFRLEQLFYDSLPQTELSDHKPVVSMFKVATFDPLKYNPSPTPYEVIQFQPIDGWKAGEDGRLWYKISNELFYRRPKMLSSLDRLALFKSDFASLEEYQTVVFANNIARMSPQLDAREVPYPTSAPSSRASSRNGSRRGSSTSLNSHVSVGTEAISLNTGMNNETNVITSTPASTPDQNPSSTPIYVEPVPDDEIGDGFKYFTAVIPDEVLIPGKYIVLYLKTSKVNEYNVYGISSEINVSPR